MNRQEREERKEFKKVFLATLVCFAFQEGMNHE